MIESKINWRYSKREIKVGYNSALKKHLRCCDQIEMLKKAIDLGVSYDHTNKDIYDFICRHEKLLKHKDRLKEQLMFWDNLQFELYQKTHEEMYCL